MPEEFDDGLDEGLDGGAENGEPPVIDYRDLVVETPPRPEEDGESGGNDPSSSMSNALDGVSHKTSIQTIIDSLTPRCKDRRVDELMQPVMVSRVQPDNVLDRCKVTVFGRFYESEDRDNFDFLSTMSNVHDAVMIGFQGRGIADRLEAAGAQREEEIKELSQKLGF